MNHRDALAQPTAPPVYTLGVFDLSFSFKGLQGGLVV